MNGLDYSGLAALVLGLGDTGLACARWLARHGARVTVADTRAVPPGAAALAADLPDVALVTGEFSDALLAAADLLVVSPGVPLATPAIARARASGKETVGDVELLARALRAEPAPPRIVAITGSNGKSTVTAMVGAMVERCGVPVCVAGNIGLPVLDALTEMESGQRPRAAIWVLELSSFQLETTVSLAAAAATVLNLSEDHLDRYPGMDAYAAAKARIFQDAGVRVVNRDDARVMAMVEAGRRTVSFGLDRPPGEADYGLCDDALCLGDEALMPVSALPVAGLHNAANALAALALARALELPMATLLAGLAHFRGLPHRVEFVAEIDGVAYYDDSKGTNVGATEAALYGLGARKAVVILGGDGKGQDFSPLRAAVVANARAAILIGRDAPLIAAALEGCGVPVEILAGLDIANLETAVVCARALAQPGDAVLLSPACASFDMFRHYAHRAEVFVAAVRALSPSPAGRGGEGRGEGGD